MNKYICVFCDERKHGETAHITEKSIGICRDCYKKLRKSTPSQPYEGFGDISYLISPYEYTGVLRSAFIEFKFSGCHAYAPLFARMMKEHLRSYNMWHDFDIIIPVPLHKKRLRERGYNQAELIAEYVSEYISVPMRTDILYRPKNTTPQSTLGPEERMKNVKDAFSCEKSLNGKSVILFDDIYTTGSTLRECAKSLSGAGAGKICAVTLSKHAFQKINPEMY